MSEIVYINFMREILCKFYVELIYYVCKILCKKLCNFLKIIVM